MRKLKAGVQQAQRGKRLITAVLHLTRSGEMEWAGERFPTGRRRGQPWQLSPTHRLSRGSPGRWFGWLRRTQITWDMPAMTRFQPRSAHTGRRSRRPLRRLQHCGLLLQLKGNQMPALALGEASASMAGSVFKTVLIGTLGVKT